MHIFVSEYISGGAWPEPRLEGSLAREGAAMLAAIVEDLASLPDVTVETTWDRRLQKFPVGAARVHVVDSAAGEADLFGRLSTQCDATLIVAPEFHQILERRTRAVELGGRRLLGPSSAAVRTCADKLACGEALRKAGVATIDARRIDLATALGDGGLTFPVVVKPRDGAGSQSTFVVSSPAELRELVKRRDEHPLLADAIVQPYIVGTPVSVAVFCAPDRDRDQALPVATQRLSDDGRLRYLGGVVPWRGRQAVQVQEAALQACRAVSGLQGYVGVDIIIPKSNVEPLVVEINPRLTTSYLGYRQILADPEASPDRGVGGRSEIAARLVRPERFAEPLRFSSRSIEFQA